MLNWEAVMSPEQWAQATFGEVRLRDERRTKRAVRLAEPSRGSRGYPYPNK